MEKPFSSKPALFTKTFVRLFYFFVSKELYCVYQLNSISKICTVSAATRKCTLYGQWTAKVNQFTKYYDTQKTINTKLFRSDKSSKIHVVSITTTRLKFETPIFLPRRWSHVRSHFVRNGTHLSSLHIYYCRQTSRKDRACLLNLYASTPAFAMFASILAHIQRHVTLPFLFSSNEPNE